MTESKRATWSGFARWVADNYVPQTEDPRRSRDRLVSASRYVGSESAAVSAIVAAGYAESGVTQLRHIWLGGLAIHGVAPPADPPSVAEVLESVAAEFTSEADRADDERVKCVVAGPATEAASVYWEGQETAFRDAAGRVRAKAKEFA